MTHRALTLAAAGLAGALLLTGCGEEDTELAEERVVGGVPSEELVGEEMTLTNEVAGVFGQELITIGDDETMVFVEEMPEGLGPGDDVEVTGVVAVGDPLDVDDLDRLNLVTDSDTATYLIDRGSEPYLEEATITPVG